MLPSFARHAVTVVTPGVIDDHGNRRPDWGNPVSEVEVKRCSVQPIEGQESYDHRDAVLAQYYCYMPPTVAVTAQDGVRWNGVLYLVVAEPRRWIFGVGSADHVLVLMNRWEG